MASTYIQRIPSSAGNRKTFTFSAWIKGNTTNGALFSCGTNISNGPLFIIDFISTQVLRVEDTISGGSQPINVRTNRVFRDTNAWYHIVVAVDTTQGTASDRVKIYVNGVQETSLSTATYPNQNIDTSVNNTDIAIVGCRAADSTGKFFDGSMSHVHFTDGYAYTPTSFGETDSTTGEWKIKTSVTGVNYGTNGFWWLKDSIATTDHSPNSNTFTVATGTLTKSEDCPSNVFATMNALGNYVASTTLSNGNNTVAMTTSKGGNLSTLSCTGGKYYAEMKIATAPQDFRFHWGILPKPISAADDPINGTNGGIMLSGYNAAIYAGASGIINNFYGSATGRFSGNPILGLAIDLESATNTMAISVNGAWITGSNTTDASFSNALKVDITSYVATQDDWFIGCGSGNSSGTTGVYNLNFGNGYFGTTAVSSAGTNASNNGIFEYDVPTGYTALSTKGLNL